MSLKTKKSSFFTFSLPVIILQASMRSPPKRLSASDARFNFMHTQFLKSLDQFGRPARRWTFSRRSMSLLGYRDQAWIANCIMWSDKTLIQYHKTFCPSLNCLRIILRIISLLHRFLSSFRTLGRHTEVSVTIISKSTVY